MLEKQNCGIFVGSSLKAGQAIYYIFEQVCHQDKISHGRSQIVNMADSVFTRKYLYTFESVTHTNIEIFS